MVVMPYCREIQPPRESGVKARLRKRPSRYVHCFAWLYDHRIVECPKCHMQLRSKLQAQQDWQARSGMSAPMDCVRTRGNSGFHLKDPAIIRRIERTWFGTNGWIAFPFRVRIGGRRMQHSPWQGRLAANRKRFREEK
jgi:hypothetical protein